MSGSCIAWRASTTSVSITTQRRDVVHRFEAALRLLDESCRVYQYLCKRRIDPVEAAPCRQPIVRRSDPTARGIPERASGRAVRDRRCTWSSSTRGSDHIAGTSTQLRGLLRRPAASAARLAVVRAPCFSCSKRSSIARSRSCITRRRRSRSSSPTPSARRDSQKADAFRFFRRLVNYAPAQADGRGTPVRHAPGLLRRGLARSSATAPIWMSTTSRVKVLTMKEPPAATFAHLLEDLYTVPGEFIACLEWRRIPNDRMRRDIQTRRRHFFNKRVSLVNYVAPDTRPEEMLVDESASATVKQLGDALTRAGGQRPLLRRVFAHPRPLRRRAAHASSAATAEAIKVMAAHDGTFVEETLQPAERLAEHRAGQQRAQPAAAGAARDQLRGPELSVHARSRASDECAISGARRSPSSRRGIRRPYHFNLHVEDVGHTLVLGATGSGKSFLLNFLVTHAQKYEPLTVIFDLGHSYRKLATLLQGSYLELGLRQRGVTINPVRARADAGEPALPACVRPRAARRRGRLSAVSDVEDRELYEAIENLYVLDASQRRLFTLANLLPRALAGRLSKWIEGGRYARPLRPSSTTP